MKNIFLLLVVSITFQNLVAQNFIWQSNIDSVNVTNFYRVLLNPGVVSKLKTDFSDIRIFDSRKNEIPYIISRKGFEKSDSENMIINAKPEIFCTENKNEKTSYIRIKFPEKQLIHKIDVNVSNTDFYLRKFRFATPETLYISKNKTEIYYNSFYSGELSSKMLNKFNIYQGVETAEFYLIIENNDNKPLNISNVVTFQNKSFLIARFETGNRYFLKFGDVNCNTPEYDLKYLKDSLFKLKLPLISAGLRIDSVKIDNPKKEIEEKAVNPNNLTIIWGAIILVTAILSFITWKLVSELKKRNN